MRVGHVAWALCLTPTAVAEAPIPDAAYRRAVDLVDRLYLAPDEIDAAELLRGAAFGLSEDIHWLVAREAVGEVHLAHGDGTPIGAVRATTMAALPEALRELESLVLASGHDPGVDVRLSVLEGMTEALDRNSRILAGDQQWRFSVRLKGEVVGIGATLHRDVGGLVVADLQEKEPAELAGLALDDVVLRIDGHSTINMPEDEAARLLHGAEGTPVVLSVRRGDPPRQIQIPITRARVVEPNVIWRVLDGGVGYVRITHISQRTVYNLRRKLERLREKDALGAGLVVDLRGNTGGSMQEAALSADVFVDEGLLLRTDGPDGGPVQSLEREMRATPARPGWQIDVPVVLVVDDHTASGAEILAGALVELGRAATVGTRTYGKGTVQKLYNLTDDDSVQLKLTVAQYVLANERRIAGEGIVPDVVVGQVWLDAFGVRFIRFDEAIQRTPWAGIVPELHEQPGWRGVVAEEVDLPLEIARRAVLRSEGPRRDTVLAAIREVAEEARAEQSALLGAALEHRDLDWSAPPSGEAQGEGSSGLSDAFIDAEVVVRSRPDEGSVGDVIAIEVEVENRGEAPLTRALVELGCPTFPIWHGLAVPVGLVGPGERARGSVSVPFRPGVVPREDLVSVRLRADRVAPLEVGEQVLAARSTELPQLALRARLAPHTDAQVHRAEVTLQNLAGHPVSGLEVSFAYPGDLDVELLDPIALVPVLPSRGEQRVDLAMRLGPAAPEVLEMEVVVRAERYDTLAQWPIRLARDGSVVTLQEPRIELASRAAREPGPARSAPRGAWPLSAPVGPLILPLVVTDETALDHVVVFADEQKVAWVPGGKPKVAVDVALELRAGINQVRVVAVDADGVGAETTRVIRGEAGHAMVDARD